MKQNDLVSKKHKKVCNILNNIEHLLILTPTFAGCFCISTFASLFGIPVTIASFTVEIKISAKLQ